MDLVINLAGLAEDSIVDGPGIRVALFAQGCPRRCAGCHNPQTHAFGVGEDFSVEQLYQVIRKNPLAKGVTFSGGEPFAQAEAFLPLAEKLRSDGYELAAYSGYTFDQLRSGTPAQQQLLSLMNVLIDGEFVLAQKNLDLRWRGSANQRILDVPQSLLQGVAVLSVDPRWQ
ncbi:MAG: anaerobic ribonucleoside-triphosphate reductase activating protein [Angelakisella sp.]